MGIYKRAFIKRANSFLDDITNNPGATAAGAATGAALGFGGSRLAGAGKGTTAIMTLLGMLGGGVGGGKLGAYLDAKRHPGVLAQLGNKVNELSTQYDTPQNRAAIKRFGSQSWNNIKSGKGSIPDQQLQAFMTGLSTALQSGQATLQQVQDSVTKLGQAAGMTTDQIRTVYAAVANAANEGLGSAKKTWGGLGKSYNDTLNHILSNKAPSSSDQDINLTQVDDTIPAPQNDLRGRGMLNYRDTIGG